MGAAGWGDLQGRVGWVAEPVCKERGGLCQQGPHGAGGARKEAAAASRARAASRQSSALRTLLFGCAPPSGQRALFSHRSQESGSF